jgi:two-component system chemotaxis sensor kinase CheA
MSDEFFDRTEFVQYFRDETDELLQQIDADLLRLEAFIDSDTIDPEIVNSLFRALHTIKGSAGMLDYRAVSSLAHSLESVFDLLRKDRIPLSESFVDLLFEGRDLMNGLVRAAVGDGEEPVYTTYIERLDAFAEVYESTAAVIEGKPTVGANGGFPGDDELAPVDDVEVAAFEAEVARLLAQAQGLGDEAAPTQPVVAEAAPVAAAAPMMPTLSVEPSVPVSVSDAQAAVDDLFASFAAPAPAPKPVAEPAPAPKPAPAKAAKPVASAPAAEPVRPTVTASNGNGSGNAPAADDGDAAAAVARRAAQKSQTIRVDIDRLDQLLNLVGELVINRTRISDIATTLGRSVTDQHAGAAIAPLAKELADSSALLARTTNEIQESIMKVRMVPIGQVFDRFPRMVRDLAKARNKEIHLKISGAETDLDKTIVDEVGEPLMHLVRNCVDHGIEDPDDRAAASKPRAGTIHLNAYHEGNQVIIEVSDDGGGIDLEKVRRRGIKQGLIKETDRPSDREIVELIFTPGFSTAEQVTDVSGRGVGMDVVKKNILRLKGIFDVDSVFGQGTKFTMKLPLTLAIIQALLVRVADELYSIPLDSVIESQRIESSDVRTVHGGEVITLRGQVVPLIRVGEFFGIAAPRDPEKVMIVIVSLQGRQVGLVVDSFQGEQEIVIKPLSDVIGRIAGISGATILGNGLISLIIDVHSLVSGAYGNGKVARAEFSGV